MFNNNLGTALGTLEWLPAPSASFDAASLAIFAAFSTPPTSGRKTLIDTCVKALKSASVWTKLDALYVFAAADSQAALINWKAPGTFDATAVSGPTFTADRGFTGDGSADHIDSNFNPSTAGGSFTLNSACLFGWSLTGNPAAGSGALAGNVGSFSCQIFTDLFDFQDTWRGQLNGASPLDIALAGTARQGLYSSNQSASNAQQAYRQGASVGTGSASVSSVDNSNICFLRCNSLFSDIQCAAGGAGGSLSSGEQGNLYDALLAYLQGVGAA